MGEDKLKGVARRGLNKFCGLRTSKLMKAYGDAYTKKTGKNSYCIDNKAEFYKFVAKNKVKI